MRRGAVPALTAVLVAGPTVLAFASGGFFPHARLVAAIGAWAVLGLAALAAPAPVVPRTAPVCAALVGLAALAAWTALSGTWAPSPGPARQSLELALVYLPALAAAALLLRERGAARFAEVALAAGTLVVIGYGLAGRLLPGVVHLSASVRAGGRLEQPLTYWNATGALAALGFVLAARIGGDRSRPGAPRARPSPPAWPSQRPRHSRASGPCTARSRRARPRGSSASHCCSRSWRSPPRSTRARARPTPGRRSRRVRGRCSWRSRSPARSSPTPPPSPSAPRAPPRPARTPPASRRPAATAAATGPSRWPRSAATRCAGSGRAASASRGSSTARSTSASRTPPRP